MATDVKVPALGESITEGTLAQWLKKPGERSPRTSRSPASRPTRSASRSRRRSAGVLAEQLVKEGDTVAVGAVIARIDENATAAAAAPLPPHRRRRRPRRLRPIRRRRRESAAARAEHAPEPAPAAEDANGDQITTLSPAVRRAVLEHHVDPSKIQGTGKDGRLTKDDVLAAAEAQKTGGPVHEPEARVATPPQPAAPAPAPAPAPQAPAQATPRRTPRRARQDDAPAPDHRHTASRKRRTPPRC